MDNIINTLGPIVSIVALVAVSVLLIIFWVSMIASAVKNSRLSNGGRVTWVLVIVILELLGAVIYYFAVHKPGSAKLSKK